MRILSCLLFTTLLFFAACKEQKANTATAVAWSEKPGMISAPAASGIKLPYYTPKIQMRPQHIAAVARIVQQIPQCKLLIWGLGYDSKMWCALNKNGTTIFIEDNAYWAKKIGKTINCKVVMVTYSTKVKDAKKLLNSPTKLFLRLPKNIAGMKFDVIVVDAPAGYNDNAPGRMSSIYMSTKLAHKNTHIFVDDYKRLVERTFADTYLAPLYGKPTVYTERLWFAHFGKRTGKKIVQK